MKNKTSHPERYYYASLICLILLILNYYRTDGWTGDKPFSEFAGRDWQLLAVFLIEEFIIICAMVVFWLLGNNKTKKRTAMFIEQWEKGKYSGIKPGDYDYVWFDFSNKERALILQQGNLFMLYVQKYDDRTGNWESSSSVSVYDSLEAVKKALYYECEFYCEENVENLVEENIENHTKESDDCKVSLQEQIDIAENLKEEVPYKPTSPSVPNQQKAKNDMSRQ